MSRSRALSLSLLFVLAVEAGLTRPAAASTEGPTPDDTAAVTHADSVVAGRFTGRREVHVREIPGAIDERGQAFTDRVAYTAHAFEVTEHLAGTPTPAVVSIHVPGALPTPTAGARVVVGLDPDGSEGGYNMVYGRFLDAEDDAALSELRTFVADARAPRPIDPQAMADQLGQARAEAGDVYDGDDSARDELPEPGYDGSQDGDPLGLGAALTKDVDPHATARVQEPDGDPRHPAEGESLGSIGALNAPSGTAPGGASRGGIGGARADRGAHVAPSEVNRVGAAPRLSEGAGSGRRRGLLVLGGVCLGLLGLGGALRWRAR